MRQDPKLVQGNNSSMQKSKISIPKELSEHILTPLAERLAVEHPQGKVTIGIPKELKFSENRIALTPSAVRTLVQMGHRIRLETGAGEKSNFSDYDYSEAGAEILADREQLFKSQVILKVAPPSLEEIDLGHPGQIIISPIHLPALTEEYIYRLKQKRITAMAMEYMKDSSGSFPFVRMMSEIAGVSAMQTAADLLSHNEDGRGVLLGGIAGVPPAKVVILGAGVVAEVATRVALGYGAEVRLFDNNIRKLMRLQSNLGHRLYTGTFSSPEMYAEIRSADVVLGAIHSETGRTPCIVGEDTVEQMKPGSVIIDVSIDQGGCFATSRLSTHEQPSFIKHDVLHYCVPNIVSRYPKTSSAAISNILVPLFAEAGSTMGIEALLRSDAGFRNGVYMYKGSLTNQYMSERFNIKYMDIDLLLMTNL
nr:alanine dehydrogenase [Saprospira grandis]